MKRLSARHALALDLRARGLDAAGIARTLGTTETTARRLLSEGASLVAYRAQAETLRGAL